MNTVLPSAVLTTPLVAVRANVAFGLALVVQSIPEVGVDPLAVGVCQIAKGSPTARTNAAGNRLHRNRLKNGLNEGLNVKARVTGPSCQSGDESPEVIYVCGTVWAGNVPAG
jgi:hypothetical protein